MAFRPLTEAECGQGNPLAQLTSHVLRDHTFSDNHGQIFPSTSDQLVEQFLQETRAVPQTFRMDDLMREMHEIESQRSVLPPIPASAVKDQLYDNAWAQQYLQDGKVFHDSNHEAIWAEIISQEQKMGHVTARDQMAGPSHIHQGASELRHSLDDPRFVYSKFMRFMNNVEDQGVNVQGGKLTEEEAQAWSNEYLKSGTQENEDALAQTWIEENENAEHGPTTEEECTAWANAFLPDKGQEGENAASQSWAEEYVKTNEDEFNSKFWDKLQEEMKKVVDGEDTEASWIDDFNNYNAPQQEYTFSEENPMLEVDNPLERGKQLLEQGDFPSAVLCFETAVKRQQDSTEAWLLLGTTQAENEQDPNAIPALNRCLQLEPENLKALMALAVCYTNESYFNQAAHMLLNWLKYNPKYADLVPPNFTISGQVTSFLDPKHQKVIQSLYIKAAQRQPDDVDHEVQTGLGVLFTLSGEYEKAVDCFRTALSVRLDDARLWNRLGATLANSSRAEEAVDAYHHALDIAPGFIRARYNVGVICINLRAYKEAAEHFLTALNQQARGKAVTNSDTMSQMSQPIWATLRMCIAMMNRPELKEAVDNRDLQTLNKAFDISND